MIALAETLKRYLDKDYRDGYVQTRVRAGVAYQIKALRRKFGLSQSEMAQRTEKKQSVISRLENTEYGKVTVQTLLDIASGLDVALLVQFVSYPDFLKRTADMSDKALQPDTIHESFNAARRDNSQTIDYRKFNPVLSPMSAQVRNIFDNQNQNVRQLGLVESQRNQIGANDHKQELRQ
ncbi:MULTISPECIES: helix-turn-helix transcriptional regulator [unclassified Mesorhizobium]|uniref:helix-turn-helix domain-containing protein n=1 Tax=unclassified Mesorhizobium TaxID=325217 RepID=UPI0013DED0D2|nr:MULTISPECIES: helix-turn-helix transcriptional regulator [unclassified Mesorhizobium]